MGKKKNKNKKKQEASRKKDQFSKKQFAEIYCPNCGLCINTPANPTFCHEELYKTDPNRFFRDCFGSLIVFNRRLKEKNGFVGDITLAEFNDLICDSFCKNDKCGITATCFRAFKDQIFGRGKEGRKNKKEKLRKKKQKQYICQPYPSVFTNDCKEWQDKIEQILSNGNNYRKQDKVEESTKQSEGHTDQ